MELFEGYVLQSELSQKAGVANSLFKQLKSLKFTKMGGLVCILKDSLPSKYKEIAEKECLDLSKYWSFSYISIELGMCEDYMSQIERYKTLVSKRIEHIKLFELSDEFIKKIKSGLTPFKIKNKKDEEYAKQIIEMQGLKIGFY